MLCGISNSVSSHEIANTSTLTIKNHNHNRIHSEFPNNHFNKIHMLKTETGKRSPAGYSWVPNEKFGIRPQSLGLYQSNPMLHDQRGLGSNTNPSDSSHRPTILSPDISRKEDFNSKSYSKKRRGTFDNNNKNVTVPTSLVSPNITYNSNNTSKSEKFKTNLPYFHSSHPKKSTSRTSSRESIRERSPVKLFSAKETHFQNYNATGNARESYKYAAVVNKYKEKSQPISDETTKVSQTRSASTPSRNLPQDEDKNAKNVEFQKLHEPHLSSSQIKSHEANKLIKDDNNTQSLSKKNELQNVISPSIISQRTDHLNITFLATSDNNTPIWSTNPLPINALTNSSVARLCDLTDPADAFNSNKQNLTHDNYINNDLDEFTQLQSVYSQITHKQKTKQKCNLPNSNSAASSLSAGDDRTFCDSGISSSSYSKDSACTSPSDPNAYNPMPSLGINEWVSTCKIPCDKEPIFDSNCHQKPNQGIPLSKSSRIPSISKLTDRPKMNTSTEMVDSQPAFSTIQRTQRPKTVGKLICQSGKEITSVISQNNDIDSQSPSLKFNHDVNSLNKISQSAKHLCDNASRLYSTPSSSNAIISKRPNKIFINSTSDEVSKSETMNVKIHNDTDNTTTTSTTTNKTNTTTLNNANNYNHNCNINKDLRPDNFIKFEPSKSNETIDDIECNQLNQMYISNKMNKQHNHSHQQLKLSNDQQHKIFHNQSSVIISDCDKSKVKRDNGKSTILFDEPSLKITCNELGQLTDTREMNSYFKPCSRSGVIPRPRELFSLITSEKLVGDQKKSPDIKPIKSSVVTSEPEISLLSKSLPGVVAEDPYHKPADFTNDPDLLLSSLSKLSCDPCLEDNSWDQNYFSDVESEYAALELILPIPKRESLTEAEIALELDKKLSEAIPDQVSGAFVNIINPNTSLANNVVSSGKCLEPGYFSDTEAIFSSQRKFKPLSDPNNCKLPIASVAPIMSTQPAPFRNVLHENKKRLLAPNNINLKTNELSSPLQCTSKIDGMMQIQEIKWPRLCSLQNLVHSENKGRLRHSSNHHDAINKTSLRVTNCTISTGPLSQVKLPYPTASMMVNVGSLNDITAKSGGSHYEGQRKGIHNTHSELDQCRTSGAASALNCPSIKSADLMIENFRQETKRLQDHITVLSSHLSVKDSKIETLEETMENMVVRLEQLQAMDNFKNSEIHELQNIINQLRGDDMNSKSSVSSPSHFQPKPPRSTSCRTLPDAMYQDLQDAVSLNSFTSGTSAGSQDPSIHSQQQQQQKMNSKSDEKCSSQISRSPSALDTERSYVKHSHWLRASFSKAFKKRAKSNIRPNDSEILMNDNSTTNLQSTLHDQVTENNHKLQCEQQLDRLYLTVSRMRWQMDLLEARNKKLQEIILKYNPDEVLRNELYTVKLEKKVSLYDLSTHHFQDSCQFVQVFVHTESICQRNLDKISNTSQCRDQPAANNNSEDTPFNCIRSFKIGCTGLLDEMTWEDLDERLQKLLQYYINFLDPNNQLQLESLELQAYQLNFTFTEQNEIKTQSIVRSFTPHTLSSSSTESQSQISCTILLPTPYTDEQIYSKSPIVWINDMINKHDTKHYTLSIQIHLKGCTMKFPLQKDQKPPHQQVFEQKEMLKYVCFGSLIPLITLNTYLSTIRDNSIVIIYGASGTGKSQLVNDLTKILVSNPHIKNAVYNFCFKHDGSTTVKELKNTLTQQLNSFTNYGYPEVINLLNIHHFQGSLSDLFSILTFSSNCPKIIGTSGTGNSELEKFLIDNQIKVINHLSDINDAKEYLERSLNRKLIQYRLFNEFYSSHGFNEDKDSLDKFVTQVEDKNLNQLISWLTEFWNQLHEIPYSLLQSNQFTIFGIRTFLTCPMHSQLSLNWFLDLWNNMLVPILFKDIKNVTTSTMPTKKEPLNNIFKTLNNILGWITITWPWNPTVVNFPKSIREPKITLTQNSISMMKNYQLTLSTLCNSDVEVCQHRTSMDSGIILDGINPTNNNLFSCFENNSNIMYGNNYYNHYHYPYGMGDNYNVQHHGSNTTDCNQLTTTTSYQLKNENRTRGNCTKTVTSVK
ncbi:unnamed protein product [Schistosoma margrebowiei]|uniref:CortBP2/NAV1-like AAA+ ATPase lid domain-containing protein n=1 Tax=Schistosoma margrebowiei TaxID=48269 RepID=A0AA84ZY32_9TREM|nr:unnamed protein product [Schistosoma margrebowiei]